MQSANNSKKLHGPPSGRLSAGAQVRWVWWRNFVYTQIAMTSLSEDDILLVTRALEHYNAYLLATQRQDPRYLELAERLKRKPPEAEKQRPAQQRKRG